MKMRIMLLVLCAGLVVGAAAQSLPDSLLKKQVIHGVVLNDKNKPLRNVSVAVEGEEKGTFTDSLGYYKIEAKANGVLIFVLPDYEPLMEMVNGRELITATLSKTPQVADSKTGEVIRQQQIANAFQDFSRAEAGTVYKGSTLPIFHQSEATRGSRYLFKDWVHGSVVNDKGVLINDEDAVFNYDKMKHGLLVTKDRRTMIMADMTNVQSFTLHGDKLDYIFEKVPAIDKEEFLIGLVKSPGKYSLYKTIKTHFEKANYQSAGLVESGKDYDEFVDEDKFYVVYPNGQFKAFDLRRKSIKEALSGEHQKVSTYFTQHKDDILDEIFLAGLVRSLNQ